jgi:hypothetical protein
MLKKCQMPAPSAVLKPFVYPKPFAYFFHAGLMHTGLNSSASVNELRFSHGGWQEGHGGGVGDQPFFVEGVRQALDTPGEWWWDEVANKIYMIPNTTTAPATTAPSPLTAPTAGVDGALGTDTAPASSTPVPFKVTMIAPQLPRLIEIIGSQKQGAGNTQGIVSGVVLDGEWAPSVVNLIQIHTYTDRFPSVSPLLFNTWNPTTRPHLRAYKPHFPPAVRSHLAR